MNKSIHKLVMRGDIGGLRATLLKGAAIETFDEAGHTPLMLAVMSAKPNLDLIQLLLDHGANPNAICPGNDTIKRQHAGNSVLEIAVETPNLEKIKALVRAGADVRYVDQHNYSILLQAAFGMLGETGSAISANDQFDIFDFLIACGAPLDVVSKHGESVLSVSSGHGRFETVKYFLERGADPKPLKWTPLFTAIAYSKFDDVQALLNQGASVEDVDRWQRTPFLLSVHAGELAIAQLLLARGSDRSATGRCGHTALMYAIERDDLQMLKWLIAEGWDVEQADDFGNFPLAQACSLDSVECFKALLDAGASSTRRDEYGYGLMHSAASPRIVELLLATGEDLSDITPEMRSRMTGTKSHQPLDVSKKDYRRNENRRFLANEIPSV